MTHVDGFDGLAKTLQPLLDGIVRRAAFRPIVPQGLERPLEFAQTPFQPLVHRTRLEFRHRLLKARYGFRCSGIRFRRGGTHGLAARLHHRKTPRRFLYRSRGCRLRRVRLFGARCLGCLHRRNLRFFRLVDALKRNRDRIGSHGGIFAVCLMLKTPAHRLCEIGQIVGDDSLEEVVLAGEEYVNIRRGDAGFPGDAGQRHLEHAVAFRNFAGCGEYRRTHAALFQGCAGIRIFLRRDRPHAMHHSGRRVNAFSA